MSIFHVYDNVFGFLKKGVKRHFLMSLSEKGNKIDSKS